MSAKTVSSDIIIVVNRKRNRLYDNIIPVLKSVGFTRREEWVIAVQTILQ